MKKAIILCLSAVLFYACGGSGSSTDTTYKIKEGSLTAFGSPATSYTSTFGASSTGTHAIIYSGTIGGKTYVGIALSDNNTYPVPTGSYNLKIYFIASSIPEGTVNPTTLNDGLTIKYNNSDISENITLNLTKITGTTYTTYTITGTGLTSSSTFSATAIKVGS